MSTQHPHHTKQRTTSTSTDQKSSSTDPTARSTIKNPPRETRENPQARSKDRAHLGITIRRGRRPPAERVALRTTKINTPPPVLIFGCVVAGADGADGACGGGGGATGTAVRGWSM